MLGNKIFSFFKTAVKFTVLISVVLFLISKPASTDSLSVQADYYAQPKSAFSRVLDRLGAIAGRVIFGVDVSSPASIVKGSFPDDELYLWAPEDDIIFGGEEISDSLKMEVEKITEGLKLEPLDLKGEKEDIKILIYHTHNDESFKKQADDVYKETSEGRTYDQEYSIVKVGEVLTQQLTDMGYTVIHDKTDHISPGFYTAYERSLKTVEKHLKEEGEFDLVIDLHRDAYNTVKKPVNTAEVNGRDAARIMFVIGTAEGTEGNRFDIKPNWQYNLKIAQTLTDYLNGMNDYLCKDVNMKTNRYNQHLCDGSVLIEMGNHYNTLEEVMYSAELLAEAIDMLFSAES